MLNHLPEILLSHFRLFLVMIGAGMLLLTLGSPSGAETPMTIETLTQLLDSSNERDRKRAARAIGAMEPFSPQVISLLRKLLKDESEQVLSTAIQEITQLGSQAKGIQDSLIHTFQNQGIAGSVRSDIPKALTSIDPESESVRVAILRQAQNPNEDMLVRIMSMRTFTTLQNADAPVKSTLESLAKDESIPIKVEAILQLGRLPDPSPSVWEELYEIADGKYEFRLKVSSGTRSVTMLPKGSAFHLLFECCKGERLVPILLKELRNLNEPVQSNYMTVNLLLQVLNPMGENAKKYAPKVIELLHHIPPNSSEPRHDGTRSMLFITLNTIDPMSPQVRTTLQGMKGQDPYNRDMIEALLNCVKLNGDPERKYGVLCGDPKRYSTTSSPIDQ